MRKTIAIQIILLFLSFPSYAADFEFYGIKFGMTKKDVKKIVPISSSSVEGLYKTDKEIREEMDITFFSFDHNQQLYKILTSFKTTDNRKEVAAAMVLAIQEKFITPFLKSTDIEIKSELSNMGDEKYIALEITSKTLRDKYIEHLKSEMLKKLQ
ncbi:MAG: hypothetical protein A2W53_00085 [Nitrospinae bacterium RIFCSPHIGHO2_02_39_11]|nr:MAG: hypothetical protein A2W53_00085 [Nitrospinae bacterium RIFCSPHIGHO2_02_39_11]